MNLKTHSFCVICMHKLAIVNNCRVKTMMQAEWSQFHHFITVNELISYAHRQTLRIFLSLSPLLQTHRFIRVRHKLKRIHVMIKYLFEVTVLIEWWVFLLCCQGAFCTPPAGDDGSWFLNMKITYSPFKRKTPLQRNANRCMLSHNKCTYSSVRCLYSCYSMIRHCSIIVSSNSPNYIAPKTQLLRSRQTLWKFSPTQC